MTGRGLDETVREARDTVPETRSHRRPHRPTRSCRRLASLPFLHSPVELIAVRDVHEEPTTTPSRQWRKRVRVPGTLFITENPPQPGLYQRRHGRAPPSRLFPQSLHYGVIYVQRGLHMEDHTINMARCQRLSTHTRNCSESVSLTPPTPPVDSRLRGKHHGLAKAT